MFVYQGQLKFHQWGQDETFIVVLPNGFARDGDTAYLFSQWTEDMQGRKKSNWFETVIVSGLTKTPAGGNDAFTLKGAYYTWQIETQDVYGKLNVKMQSPSNPTTAMTVQRVWQSKGEQDTGNVRIWTGKFNWQDFSHDEMAMFIAPDGLGDSKPILSIWQWTKDSSQKTKVGSFREGVQKAESGAAAGLYKFTWTSYYNITCTWNEKNETLAVHMKEGGLQQDVAPQLNMFAKIERERPGHGQ
jgi:RES domain-containing protein